MDFYDIHDQTKYQITISKPANMEDLSDLFVTKEELDDMIGGNTYLHGDDKRTITLRGVISTEVKKLTDALEASGKKTIAINDEELLEVLQKNYLTDFTDGSTIFGRHGNHICYSRRYTRKKHKATQGDVNTLWGYFMYGFYNKYGCHPPHIPRYDRSVNQFKAFKDIVGWRRVRAQISNKETVKFFRQIWDNPKEFIR